MTDATPPTQAGESLSQSAAEFWVRGGALALDCLFLAFAGYYLKGFLALNDASPAAAGVVLLSLPVLYHGLFVGLAGRTPGKMAAGVSVVAADGSPLGVPRAFVRSFVGLLSGAFFGAGYLIAAFNAQKRAVHDYAAGSRAIYREPIGRARRSLASAAGACFMTALVLSGSFVAALPALLGAYHAGAFGRSDLSRAVFDRFDPARAALDGATKGRLSSLRSAVTIYYGDLEGNYPATLDGIFADRGVDWLKSLPQVQVGAHAPSSEFEQYSGDICGSSPDFDPGFNPPIDGAKLKDTGKWGYAPGCRGKVFIDCTHLDAKGVAWYSY